MSGAKRAAELALTGRFRGAERILDRYAGSEASTWVRAYIACARGDFAGAEALASPLAASAADRGVRHAACLTLGSTLRQVGRHTEARPVDVRALRLAVNPAERTNALVSLAADRVGLGDPAGCAAYVARAGRTSPRAGWRAHIRLDWVRVELALARSDPGVAVRAALRALERSRASDARRHEAKSLLFLGVALLETGDPQAGVTLRRAETLARRIGAAEVARVAGEVARTARSR